MLIETHAHDSGPGLLSGGPGSRRASHRRSEMAKGQFVEPFNMPRLEDWNLESVDGAIEEIVDRIKSKALIAAADALAIILRNSHVMVTFPVARQRFDSLMLDVWVGSEQLALDEDIKWRVSLSDVVSDYINSMVDPETGMFGEYAQGAVDIRDELRRLAVEIDLGLRGSDSTVGRYRA